MAILSTAVVGPGGRAGSYLAIIRLLSGKYRLVTICDVGGKNILFQFRSCLGWLG